VTVTNNVFSIVIGAAVLLLLLTRQVQKRTVKEDSRPTLFLILTVIGVIDLVQFLGAHPANGTAIGMIVASLVLAAGFGALRAYTVRLWREDGVLYRQGTVVTLLLWLVAIGVHFGADVLIDGTGSAKGLSSAALLLYIAVSLGVQRFVVGSRARTVAAYAA
jgi:hypothetical protein